MKRLVNILTIAILIVAGAGVSMAQTNVPPPHIINSAGGSTKIAGGNYYGYNIGEPIVGTVKTNPFTNYFTQGFLQPDYNIGTAFNAHYAHTDESCLNAQDGAIIVNPYNGKGTITFSLSPNPSGADTTGTINNLAPGTYTLTIRDSLGRTLTKVFVIQASSGICPVTAYHAYSPNGDGLNDLYIISGIENYPDNHVYFFNRWGTKVWDAAKYDNVKTVWDGKDSHGNVLSPGTYFYVIEKGDGKKPMKSWVEITR